MKKIFILISGFLMLILLNACLLTNLVPCFCASPFYNTHLIIGMKDIKDPSVKTIKITLENLDGIKPEYNVGNNVNHGSLPITLKRYSKPKIISEKIFYFQSPLIAFSIGKGAKNLDKKRTYEIKMYVNDKLFFTKKFSFTHKGNDNFEHEFDNMEYVVTEGVGIEITDADVKKILKK